MDPISNMIVQMKNAGLVGHESVLVPHSKVKASIAELLKRESYIRDVKAVTKKNRQYLDISLILNKRIPKIRGTKRISKPSKRIYRKHSEIRPVRNGYGLLVMSTPRGVMSGVDAKRARLGGEALFSIW